MQSALLLRGEICCFFFLLGRMASQRGYFLRHPRETWETPPLCRAGSRLYPPLSHAARVHVWEGKQERSSPCRQLVSSSPLHPPGCLCTLGVLRPPRAEEMGMGRAGKGERQQDAYLHTPTLGSHAKPRLPVDRSFSLFQDKC